MAYKEQKHLRPPKSGQVCKKLEQIGNQQTQINSLRNNIDDLRYTTIVNLAATNAKKDSKKDTRKETPAKLMNIVKIRFALQEECW